MANVEPVAPRPGAGIDFEALQPRLAKLCREFGVAELSVFGSVSRGDDQPGSDVDLLYVETADNECGWEFLRLTDELAALMGREVNLVAKEGLHWVIRDRVLGEARAIYPTPQPP